MACAGPTGADCQRWKLTEIAGDELEHRMAVGGRDSSGDAAGDCRAEMLGCAELGSSGGARMTEAYDGDGLPCLGRARTRRP